MANVIHKFDVKRGDRELTPIHMPLGAKPLYIGPDPHTKETMLWAMVDTSMPTVEVFCAWIWTGKAVPDGATYVGSHLVDGWEMRHVFVGPTDGDGCITADSQTIANKMHHARITMR